jgi:hypothetical protein
MLSSSKIAGLLVAALSVVAAAAAPARAYDGVRFEAKVSSENVTLDQLIELNVLLERDGSLAMESYRAPAVPPELELIHNETFPSVQQITINGRTWVRVSEQHTYVFRPKKKGAFTIGPAAVKVGGQPLSTKPITVRVAPAPKNAMSSVGAPPPGPAQIPIAPPPATARGDEELFVDAHADKAKVWLGEQVTATWRLYTQTDVLRYRPLVEPKHEEFWSEEIFTPGGALPWDRQSVKGQDYYVSTLLKKALFPMKAGKHTISPLEAEATTIQSAFAPNASAVRKSPPITVEVMPLPTVGRPPGFDPVNVGQIEIASAVDRDKVKATDTVTWRITLKIVGNVKQVRLPPIAQATSGKIEGWKVFDPTVKERVERGEVIRGEKVYAILLKPEKGGTLTVPGLSLPYFNPSTGRYEVATTQPISVTIEGTPVPSATAAGAGPAQDNVLAQQIRPIRNRQKARSHVGDALFRGRLGLILLVAPPAAWVLLLVGDAIRRRLTRETARSKRRRARRAARRRMRVAEYHIKAARPSAFFGECARVIYEHLEYRLGQKCESLTLAELRLFLEGRGFSKETAEAIVKELETCDFARFAQSASGPGEMRAAVRRVKTLLDWIERAKISTEKEAA